MRASGHASLCWLRDRLLVDWGRLGCGCRALVVASFGAALAAAALAAAAARRFSTSSASRLAASALMRAASLRAIGRVMIQQIGSIVDRVFVLGGHLQTFCRTRNRTEVTVAAFRHVDVKTQHVQALWDSRWLFSPGLRPGPPLPYPCRCSRPDIP